MNSQSNCGLASERANDIKGLKMLRLGQSAYKKLNYDAKLQTR